MSEPKSRLETIKEELPQAGRDMAAAARSAASSAKTRYRMLVSDLDNTLLDEKKQACQEDLAAIARLVEAGFLFTFATGRGSGSAPKLYEQLGANAPAIVYNGARIVDYADGSKVIFSAVMDRAGALQVIGTADELDSTVIVFQGDDALAASRDGWVEFYEQATSSKCLVVGDLTAYVMGLPQGMELTKLVFFSEPERRNSLTSSLTERFPGFNCMGTTPHYTEILPPGISKGYALVKLARYMGLELDEIVVAGDAPNDIDMIEKAGLGAAVENAEPLVKASADIIIGAVGKGGIAELIGLAFGL